jgi:hypothetical protein
MTPAILSRVRCADQKPWTLITLIAVAWAGVKQKMLSLTYRHFVDHVTLSMGTKKNTAIF